jgi:hypothetical protein
MDDPDVDHELIALLRESLGFSNKAQDGVSSNTGKMQIFFVLGYLPHVICYATVSVNFVYDFLESVAFAAVLLTRSQAS